MPFISHESCIPEVAIGIWHIEEDELFFLERVKLYENEWKRLAGVVHPQKRLEWLSSRLCMKELLDITNNSRVESLNNDIGKPYLTNHSHNISYTHSTHYSAAIASRTLEVGIDIEYLKRRRNIKTRFLFMNEAELASYDQDPDFNRFILAWSAKETVYKLHGRGVAFKDNIFLDLQKVDPKVNGILPATVKKDGLSKEYEVHYAVYPEFILTYCVDRVSESTPASLIHSRHSGH